MKHSSLPYRAVWISFLEYEQMDFSTEKRFKAEFNQLALQAKAIGFNTLIVHVRPFSDALYFSRLFPFSHLLTGTQGKPVSYDPLDIMVECAHAAGLKLEAWINPYRISSQARNISLCMEHPAKKWMHEDRDKSNKRVILSNESLYYNPASSDVRKLIADGVEELVDNYPIDGIHMDDYFYPSTLPDFDRGSWQNEIMEKDLASWRRHQVNQMVQMVYTRVHQRRKDLSFGISPQGNPDVCYNVQYSDAIFWLKTPGYVDYIMPQLYWGVHPKLDTCFIKSVDTWKMMPRNEQVKLYAGLGAYHIGIGDETAGNQQQWFSGNALKEQINILFNNQKDYNGFSVFRYGSLWGSPLADSERAALQAFLFNI